MKHAVTRWAGALIILASSTALSVGEELRSTSSDIELITGSVAKPVWPLRNSKPLDTIPGTLLESFSLKPVDFADNISLRSFIGDSLLQSEALRSTLHEYRASLASKHEAVFGLLPTVTLEFDANRTRAPNALGQRTETDQQTVSLNLDWRVFSSGAGLAQIKASQFAAEAARYQAIDAERRVIVEALSVYLELLAASKQVEAFEKSRAGLQKVLRGTKKQFKAGFASRTDVAQIEGEIAEVSVFLEETRNTLQEQKIRWKAISGKKPSTALSWPSTDKLIPDTREATVSKALENNHLVASATNTAQSEHYRAKAEMAGFLPRVDLYGQISRNVDVADFGDGENDYRIGARLTVPILNLAATSRYRRSRELAFAAKYRARDTERRIRTEIKSAWVRHESLRKQESLIRKRISTGKQIRTGLTKEFRAGLRPVSDYLRQEVRLARLEQELIANRIQKTNIAWQILMQFDSASIERLIR